MQLGDGKICITCPHVFDRLISLHLETERKRCFMSNLRIMFFPGKLREMTEI